MANLSFFLNFEGETLAAFEFYKKVFGTELAGNITRYGDAPPQEGKPPLTEKDKSLVMHLSLPIMGGIHLHGADVLESMGPLNKGNNFFIMLEPDTRKETDTLFSALLEGGKVNTELQVMFWGDYFGSLVDKFGVQWMLLCSAST